MKNQIFNIAVCDDVQTDREEIAEMTEEICTEKHICHEIISFEDAENLIDSMRQGNRYDLLLLDVQMPGMDGMELARVLRSKEEKVSIVFMSCNREMALLGYEVSAARYLAKPVDKDKLEEAILFCYELNKKDREILLPVNGSMRKVSPKGIYYIEIVGRKSRIRLENEEWDTSLSLAELEDMLPGQEFIRCHQSFIVNCRYVQSFHTSSMELTDGRSVPVSKHRIKEVRQAFFDYMKN